MATERKAHDVVLPEVRKPPGYGRLVAVIAIDDSTRELWFQHEKADTLRAVRVAVTGASEERALTIRTRGMRERQLFKF